MENLVSIGKILNFHGIKGEVKIGFTKGRENFIAGLKAVFVKFSGEVITLNVDTVRFHKQFALIKFKEINSINDAEMYKGLDVFADRADIAGNLEEDEYLISDLIGMSVYSSDDEKIGTVEEVGNNNAGEILRIKDGVGNFHLIPFVKDLVPVVDLTNNMIVINNIRGLIE